MKLSVYDFLHRGYFPKELPPSFNTYHFAIKYEEVRKEWLSIRTRLDTILTREANETEDEFKERKAFYKSPVSHCSIYSIAKGKLCRRSLAILNPVNFLDLALYIDDSMSQIEALISRSPYSNSKPTYSTDIEARCYKANSQNVQSLLMKKLKLSCNKTVEIKLDINNFYPSIYTHSITWAIVGKEKAKELWKKNGNRPITSPTTNEESLYNIGYQLDNLIEHCQDKQTSGIPVGPDSSFIVAEIITSYIDEKISKEFQYIKACRYYDDYSIFVSSREEAEKVIRYIQQVLSEFELSVNESKLEIHESPRHFREKYAEELGPFQFSGKNVKPVLIRYFNLLWKLCELDPNRVSTIIRYGLQSLKNNAILIDKNDQKELFESFLYKTALIDPSSLNLIHDVLTRNGITPTHSSLEEIVFAIINQHAPLSHHHEVAWGLWYCKKYALSIDKDTIIKIFNMHNAVCTLMLMDYINNNATALRTDPEISGYINAIGSMSNDRDLFGKEWILLYEGAKHGWLSNTSIVTSNPYFKYLYDNDISFYDENVNADYQSYDYLEQLPYNVYPQAMYKTAKEKRTEIFRETYDSLFQEIDDNEDLSPEDKGQRRQKYKDIVHGNHMDVNIFNRVLSQLFRRDDVDIEKYVKEVKNEIMELLGY